MTTPPEPEKKGEKAMTTAKRTADTAEKIYGDALQMRATWNDTMALFRQHGLKAGTVTGLDMAELKQRLTQG